jgi:hypothetical protein
MSEAQGITGGMRPEVPRVSPLRGGSFAASFGRGPYVRGTCRAWCPRHRSPPVPAATSRCSAMRAGHAVRHRRGRRSLGERSAHRGGTPRIVRVGSSRLNGTSHPANAGRAYGVPLTPET